MIKDSDLEIFSKYKLHCGRAIGSKTMYCKKHPNNIIIFNSYVYNNRKRLLWHGDLDLTKDAKALEKIRQELNIKELHIFTETDGYDGYEIRNKIIVNKYGVFRFIKFAINYTHKLF